MRHATPAKHGTVSKALHARVSELEKAEKRTPWIIKAVRGQNNVEALQNGVVGIVQGAPVQFQQRILFHPENKQLSTSLVTLRRSALEIEGKE